MRRKLTQENSISRSIVFPAELYASLSDAADRLGASISEIIRECCENDLPKLIARENKRTKRRTAP